MLVRWILVVGSMLSWSCVETLSAQRWRPAKAPLVTRWAKEVSPATAHPEYPRPQLVRERWLNLNGLWRFAVAPRMAPRPLSFGGKLLVPFPIESALSGVARHVGADQRLWYQRRFRVPSGWSGQRVFLRFGAVDWECRAFVDGHPVGEHRGGYDAFSFDISPYVRTGAEHELVVATWDPTDAGDQPRGKQTARPRGIWYTATTGIWQTVWLEPVPEMHIDALRVDPDLASKEVRVRAICNGTDIFEGVDVALRARVEVEGRLVAEKRGSLTQPLAIRLRDVRGNVRAWTPRDPFLYELEVALLVDDHVIDTVRSYFGVRTIALKNDADGVPRLFLNGRPYFQLGLLDQGFWPDGLYTAPTDAALRYDIEVAKKLGFNLIRKHVKVEPARWYYWCDKLGMLVWQDMPSGGGSIGPREPDGKPTAQSAFEFERELGRMMDGLHNHPSIVLWVPFNEGWGQHATSRVAAWIRARDPSRLVNSASGWADRGVGDVHDIHVYPGPSMPRVEDSRAAVLGEFGGLGLPIVGHTWQSESNWGYRTFETRATLNRGFAARLKQLGPLVARGLAAAVYTQTTDVESEVNGVMTYDRAVVKLEAPAGPVPRSVQTLVPTSERKPQGWHYTTDAPGVGWQAPDFDDRGWRRGPGGFGTKQTPGAVVRTQWRGPEIWLRRTVQVPKGALRARLQLLAHHDEDAQVWFDGVVAAKLSGYTTGYELTRLGKNAVKQLADGKVVLAVHCRQTEGGQFIDVGIVALEEAGR